MHGEAPSAEKTALSLALPNVKSKIAEYALQDVWNADEFGLFYRQPPGWILSAKIVSGMKKIRRGLQFLLAAIWTALRSIL